ncbi:MAG: tRNA (adenosine(37)-N6)-threonylcarbamoyltransferase complex transferase subunit TsaD [archaeon]|jgi:N6-L-threonylcarbamoyladenine synthase
MKILAIETSCDDTCAAVLDNDRVLSSVVSTQVEFHKKFGGVVPGIARDKHKEFIDPCIEKALKQAKVTMEKIDYIAVTYGPGLAIALEVGLKKAQALSLEYKKKLIPVNHLEGHALSPFLKDKNGKLYSKVKLNFPFISMIISGGHTELVLVSDFGKYELIGQTLDDAAGEAFDKVARLLKLGYPGGPLISKVAETGDRNKYLLPKPMLKSADFNFSFSGVKTACLVALRKIYAEKNINSNEKLILTQNDPGYYDSKDMVFTKKEIADFAASFEKTMVDILVTKLLAATKKYGVKYVSIGGGVCANNYLRKTMREAFSKKGVIVSIPDKRFCTDNAGMIGIVGYYKGLRKEFSKDPSKVERDPILNFKSG